MFKKKRNQLVLVVVLLQVIFFVGWYAKEADVFDKPIATIMLKTAPYDPRDLISGQYLRLNYEINTVERQRNGVKNYSAYENNSDVWVVLNEKDGFHHAKTASKYRVEPRDGELIVKGRLSSGSRIDYGIEKYFVPEGTPEPKRTQETTVRVDVYRAGEMRINQVLVDGKNYP
jgi:uncharacterized membrane-anchored protein